MVKSDIILLTATTPITPPIEELESGTYKYVYHGTKSEFRDPEGYKKQVKADWDRYEGLTVNDVKIVQTGPHKLEPDYIWQDGLTNITEDHTDLIIRFTVASPFPFTLLLIVIGLAITAVIVYLLKGFFEKIAEAIYKALEEYPWLIPLVLIGGLVILSGVAVKKRKGEG